MAVNPRVVAGVITAAVAIATPIVAVYEGLWTTAKPDRLAYNIPTVCYGETEGVKIGDTYTKSQCLKMLEKKLPRYEKEIDRCIKVAIPDKMKAAMISMAYNVGSAGFCRSSTLRLLNEKKFKASCDAMLQWTKAGGKFRQGLLNRRQSERKLCLEGINDKVETTPILKQPEPKPAPAVVPPVKKPTPPPPPKPVKSWWQFWK